MSTHPETGQTLIGGQGELHLEIIVDRLLREFRVDANVGAPQVAYRETIRQAVRSEGKFIRQSGGRGQYGARDPGDRAGRAGHGQRLRDRVVGGTVPREFFGAVRDGVMEALQNGVLAGFPVVDVKVALVDGSYHDVDSSEIAFKVAGVDGPQGRPAPRLERAARTDHETGGRRPGRLHRERDR